jgi:hypothetical protein
MPEKEIKKNNFEMNVEVKDNAVDGTGPGSRFVAATGVGYSGSTKS